MDNFYSKIIENCFTIIDKTATEVPYSLYNHQKILLNRWASCGDNAGHLNLKAASVGSSSLALAFGMARAMAVDNTVGVLWAHEETLAQKLLSRGKRFVEVAQKSKNPYMSFPGYNRNRTDFIELENRSKVYIETAGSSTDIGRGDPVNFFIGTEVAFWKKKGLLTAILPRLPGIKIFESTGNGTTGWFYKQCSNCLEGKGTYNFTFVPWFVHWEYTIFNKIIVLRDRTDEELDLQQTFKITDNQLQWRRNKIIEMDSGEGVNGDDAFKQEFPSTPEEAFLRSGSPIFGHQVYSMIEKTLEEPKFVGDFV